ncbi:uncharacterized protein GGS22DRAFT_121685 [Annulohypoxylon maeteangense]|uniref:uncharacterized protein n=1 Tax=Annulohypoxylon maeteangense TaxID=1927788 RepID=UPI0020086BB5|nr:uncharacterized protein GGS22DRAFT_121685 [Annulohypoxylon maeteangense]KAI0885942.1 hypothetical protein GGS22DRAFT_121685 [Annulohypoxylon maeteangense]
MRHYRPILALASCFTLVASSGAYLETPEPWQVTRLNTFSPSGRPGSDVNAHLWANITNPSPIPAGPGVTFDASSANCTVNWVYAGDYPYGHVFICNTTDTEESSSSSTSKWTIEVLEANVTSPSATTNMDVRFTLTTNLTVDGDEYYKVLVGTQHFQVGENMRGSCGGSGVCSWTLRDESVPVLVQPTVVACQGTC